MATAIFNNIKRLASEQKLSFQKIESSCGLGNGTISKLENGNPTIGTLEKIATVLGCKVSDLLKDEENPKEGD